jgi:hypothetical protein
MNYSYIVCNNALSFFTCNSLRATEPELSPPINRTKTDANGPVKHNLDKISGLDSPVPEPHNISFSEFHYYGA